MSAVCCLPLGAGSGILHGEAPRAGVVSEVLGTHADGSTVTMFTLSNGSGLRARVLSHGATLAELRVPDRDGKLANVVLAPDDPMQYLKGFNASGSTIGRFANRIAGARFTLDGKEYRLAANNGANHLHGGRSHFGRRNWKGQVTKADPGDAAVEFSLISPDGDEGYPGTLRVTVTYTVTAADTLLLKYRATTDRATIVNLTNHAYFNLAGAGDILDHILVMNADRYTPTDDGLIPTGKISPVGGTPLDFRRPTRIGDRIGQLKPKPGGYDHNLVLNGDAAFKRCATLTDPASGRVMVVHTTEPGVQLYTGNHVGHRGVCLETQHFPDSIHHPSFPTVVLRPGEPFQSTTVFAFPPPLEEDDN